MRIDVSSDAKDRILDYLEEIILVGGGRKVAATVMERIDAEIEDLIVTAHLGRAVPLETEDDTLRIVPCTDGFFLCALQPDTVSIVTFFRDSEIDDVLKTLVPKGHA